MECLCLPEPWLHWWPYQSWCLCAQGHSHSQEGLSVPPLVPIEGPNKLWCPLPISLGPPSFPCPWALEPHFSLAFFSRSWVSVCWYHPLLFLDGQKAENQIWLPFLHCVFLLKTIVHIFSKFIEILWVGAVFLLPMLHAYFITKTVDQNM